MRYAFISFFIIVSILHLIFCYRRDNKKRYITKPMLIISLLAFYLTASPEPSVLIIIALICSWIGDILLMKNGDLWLLAGGTFFIAAHVCLMFRFMSTIGNADVPLIPVAVFVLVFTAAACVTLRQLKGHAAGMMILGLFVYLMINAAMNTYAFINTVSAFSAGNLLISIGALFFFISDCVLFIQLYCGREGIVFGSNFVVMLTYLLAESLIVAGELCK